MAKRTAPCIYNGNLISIKKYLDTDAPAPSVGEPESNELLTVTMDSYRSALRAIGKSAVQACPAPGRDLEQGLANLETRLSSDTLPKVVKQTQEQVEDQLQKWGSVTAEHLKGKADEVKELLIVLAGTAESVGERDQHYTKQIGGLTADLKAIANLDDLTKIRSSLMRKAAELKNCVDQMAQDGQQSLAQLRSKVSVYETKLKAVEQLAARDPLTGLANRRSAEGRMDWYVTQQQIYCVVIVDLDSFKGINDKFGHAAGDDVLRKFSGELRKSIRSTDLVARWGGDEFIVVLVCDIEEAKPQIERIRQWVLGKYAIEQATGKPPLHVNVEASIGVAQWLPGKTSKQVIALADAAMYKDKKTPPRKP